MKAGHVYLWEFQVEADKEADFLANYGPEGSWAQLFRQSSDYIETLLLHDKTIPGRYLTLDRWKTREGHDAFRADFAAQYARLDADCERLTVSERSLGAFDEWPADRVHKTP